MILIDSRNFYCSKNFKYHNSIVDFAVNIFIQVHFWLCETDFKQYQFKNCQTYALSENYPSGSRIAYEFQSFYFWFEYLNYR